MKDNPGAKLTDMAISVAYRSDDSGTTFVFTKHLGTVSADFKTNVLKGKDGAKSVSWPVGTGGKGNPGVAGLVSGTEGTIGYVEYGFAVTSKLSFATLQNKSGAFVKATAESGASTLAGAKLADDMRGFPSDPEGAGDYPITTFTWVLLHKSYADKAKGTALKAVFNYCLTEGQKSADSLGYIPLPAAVVTKVQAAINGIN
jgi:phosphate transport system substrate-binding protein